MKRRVRAFAPASVSNVACGFDVMGFAIDNPGDEVTLTISSTPGVRIRRITGDEGRLPLTASDNTAGAPVISMMKHLGIDCGVEIDIYKNMPLGSGLGSSAASAVAAAVAADALFESGLTKDKLLHFALQGEQIASGAIHADNVAPSLYGGFVLIRGYDPIDIIEIPVPDSLWCTVIHPDVEINTKESRRLLPKEIPMESAKTHWGNTAGLIAGLMKQDFGLISRSIKDVVIEPVRGRFIPCYYEMKAAAMASGALGCNISGSGPSVFALSSSHETAAEAGAQMQKALDKKISSQIYISRINNHGACIKEAE